ncbi:MAG: transglycosylase SLT domain-containing protein [Ignavibacteriota bacterium]
MIDLLNRWNHLLILGACMAGLVWGQPAQAPEDATAIQRRVASAMQESLAKQQASLRQQMVTTGRGEFFSLPRAAGLGGVTGAPSASPSLPAASDCAPLSAPEVESLVGVTAQRDGVDRDLLRSVMKQESGFRPCAVSPKGAMD